MTEVPNYGRTPDISPSFLEQLEQAFPEDKCRWTKEGDGIATLAHAAGTRAVIDWIKARANKSSF